jgi:drug/metabolite transporter (DMT)-like permease
VLVGPARGRAAGEPDAPKGSSTWTTHAALVVVQFAFASQAVEAKLAMLSRSEGGEGIFPEAIAFVRMIGGAIFFQLVGPWVAGAPRADKPRLDGRMHAKLAVLGALGVAINQALFLSGLRLSSPFVVSVLGASIPVLTAVIAVVLRKETATVRTGVGLALALAGVLFLTGAGSVGPQVGVDRGAVLVALNCVSYSSYVVLSRDIVRQLGSFRVMAWVFTYAALMFAPVGVRPLLETLPHVGTRGALLLAYIVLVPTVIAYGLNAWALGRSSAIVVTIYIYVQPLLAGVLARVQLGYPISARAGFAALLILSGVAATTRRRTMPR